MENIFVDPHWTAILKAAKERGHFDAAERVAAAGWSTCAIGEMFLELGPFYLEKTAFGYKRLKESAAVDKLDSVEQLDKKLYQKLDTLGIDFYDAVRNGRVDEAIVVFAQIEQLKADN